MPLIMGVWLSVPIRVSGIIQPPRVVTTVASRSRFSVCMMPVPGGWTRKFDRLLAAHFMKR